MIVSKAKKYFKYQFHNPKKFHPNFTAMSDEELRIVARNRETLALIAWEPYLHNPKLKHRLQMIDIPTLLLRGEHDGLISENYATTYSELIPDCSLVKIPKAGHAPDVEEAAQFTNILWNWMGG